MQNSGQVNINQIVLSNFLAVGGCLRWTFSNEAKWFVWEGIQTEVKFQKDDEFSAFTPDFFLECKNQISPMRWAVVNSTEFSEWLNQKNEFTFELEQKLKSQKLLHQWQMPSKASFEKSFEQIQKRIFAGEIEKAVPVVFAESLEKIENFTILNCLKNLTKAPVHLRPYGSWSQNRGFLGASPEVLFELRGIELQTMALAGTAPFKRSSSDFLSDPKELSEHLFVVKNLKEILEPLGYFKKTETQVLELPTLKHLVTQINIQLKKTLNFWDLVMILHPTAALGTYPHAEWKWLRNLPEQSDRLEFGAPFGIHSREYGTLALVGIRQMSWSEKKIRIGAGCGLVKQSILDREWEELLLKIESVKRILGWN